MYLPLQDSSCLVEFQRNPHVPVASVNITRAGKSRKIWQNPRAIIGKSWEIVESWKNRGNIKNKLEENHGKTKSSIMEV